MKKFSLALGLLLLGIGTLASLTEAENQTLAAASGIWEDGNYTNNRYFSDFSWGKSGEISNISVLIDLFRPPYYILIPGGVFDQQKVEVVDAKTVRCTGQRPDETGTTQPVEVLIHLLPNNRMWLEWVKGPQLIFLEVGRKYIYTRRDGPGMNGHPAVPTGKK